MTTPTPLSRGEFGAMAARRILDFLKSRRIKATWFIPGFTIESWPRDCEAVVDGGHEVAHHSWAHIPPANQSRDEEEADLVRANDAIARLTGRKARGYRSPSWDLSEHTIDLLLHVRMHGVGEHAPVDRLAHVEKFVEPAFHHRARWLQAGQDGRGCAHEFEMWEVIKRPADRHLD